MTPALVAGLHPGNGYQHYSYDMDLRHDWRLAGSQSRVSDYVYDGLRGSEMRGISSTASLTAQQGCHERRNGSAIQEVRAAVELWQNETAPGESRETVAAQILQALEESASTLKIQANISSLPMLLPPELNSLELDGCNALREISYLPAGLTELSVVGCASLERISTSLPESVTTLRICHCPALTGIAGNIPSTLHGNVYTNGCHSLNHTQRNILSIPEWRLERRLLSRAEILCDLKDISDNRQRLSTINLNFSNCKQLRSSELRDLDLSGVNFSAACFDGSKFSNVNFTEANFNNASLNRIKGENVNFSYAFMDKIKMENTFFVHSDFSYASMCSIDISDSQFIGAKLTGINLEHSKIINSDFSDTDLSEANFPDASIRGCNFTRADLRQVNMIETDVTAANFSQTNLTGVDLSNIEFLRGAPPCFNDAILRNAVLESGLDLQGVCFTEPDDSAPPQPQYLRIGDAWLYRPLLWKEELLRLYLDHLDVDHNGSLLITINSMNDARNAEKTRVMEALLRSLLDSGVDTSIVEQPMWNILGKPIYRNSALVQQWLGGNDRFWERQMERYNHSLMPAKDTIILDLQINYFCRHPDKMLSLNGSFIQTVLHGLSCAQIQSYSRECYPRYLCLPQVAIYTRQSDFGRMDGSGMPEWENKNAFNFLLLSSCDDGHAMMLTESTLRSMLNPDEHTCWHAFFLFRGAEVQSMANYHLEQLFTQSFPLFISPYCNQLSLQVLSKLLNVLFSDTALYQQFRDATKSCYSAVKMVKVTEQIRLGEIFDSRLNGWSLKEEHIAQVIDVLDLSDASLLSQAQTLLCLGAVFIRYSSRAIFGTEHDSPQVLRCYASGLLQAAWDRFPAAFVSRQNYENWQQRLQGKRDRELNCTEMLSNTIRMHAQRNFPRCLAKIFPLAWV